ncbi:hypothetical protein [Actinomadura oligospora]|uniref:hypothetical protein n=1 Tax=Actinomadura oligospora TaxID=111804 RepID=UPI0004B589AC|nr:hypothetical protein [Actinomadura oligospora]
MRSTSGFADPYNPTAEEVVRWAYDPDAYAPTQDFDLMLLGEDVSGELPGLVADPECPKRGFFLGALYVISGDAVRSEYNLRTREHLMSLLRRADELDEPVTGTWARRTRALMAKPETFQYDLWCDGGLARRPFDDPA